MKYEYHAKIINVVDGDTIDAELRAVVDIGFHMVYQVTFVKRLRLLGVDCPESRGATREEGKAASDFTRRELLDRQVVIRTEKGDAFDRWLCDVRVEGVHFNRRLVDEGFAVPFMT